MNRFCRSRAVGAGGCEERTSGYNCRGERIAPPEMTHPADCGMVLGMAYVLMQPFANLYSAEEGLSRGTLFADLDKPYEGGCCR